MLLTLEIIFLVLAALLAVPTLVLFVEVLASLWGRTRQATAAARDTAGASARPRLGVIVPAHNEQHVLGTTLRNLMPQLRDGDRLLVVADNCTDATAQIARSSGALCVERHDHTRRGKGYAMEAGVRYFDNGNGEHPPEVILFTDADVLAQPGAFDRLAEQVRRTNRPAQGQYLLDTPARPRTVDLVSRFAFTLKNRVRPLGLWQMGLPCPLFGSGMAFPWETIRQAPLASGDLVEDMRLGVDLCRQGHAPCFCPHAQFSGVLPADAGDADTQRRRWEHGHLNLFSSLPGLFARALRSADVGVLAMALDHTVQPLTVLAAELLVLLVLTLALWLIGGGTLGAVAVGIAAACVVLLGVSLALAWLFHMRRQIPPRALLGLPRYVLVRAGNQTAWLFHRQRDWIRTPRDAETAREPDDRDPPADSGSTAAPGDRSTATPTTPTAPAGNGVHSTHPSRPLPIGTASRNPTSATVLEG